MKVYVDMVQTGTDAVFVRIEKDMAGVLIDALRAAIASKEKAIVLAFNRAYISNYEDDTPETYHDVQGSVQ